MCLPWTWFMAVYIQFSFILCIFHFLYAKFTTLFLVVSGIVSVGSLIANGLIIGLYDTGVSPSLDPDFFDMVYIKPWTHFNSIVLMGMSVAAFLHQYTS